MKDERNEREDEEWVGVESGVVEVAEEGVSSNASLGGLVEYHEATGGVLDRPEPKPTGRNELRAGEKSLGLGLKPLAITWTGNVWESLQQLRDRFISSQSILGLWWWIQSRPKMIGYPADTIWRGNTLKCLLTISKVITSWVINPDAIGWSSTAMMGIGTLSWWQERECLEANFSEIQDVVAPLSMRANILMDFQLGNEREMEMKKWDGELRDGLETEKMKWGEGNWKTGV